MSPIRRPPTSSSRLGRALALGLLLAVSPASAAVGPWQSNDQSQVRLISPWTAAPAAGELELGLHFRLAPGWHVYWINSGDAGFPPRVELTAPGLTGGDLRFPAPERYELPGGLQSFGYEQEVVYPLRARLTGSGEQSLEIVADLDYLVCEIDCIPYRYRIELEQPLASQAEADPEAAALLASWQQQVPEDAAGLAILAVDAELSPPGDEPSELLLSLRGIEPAPGADLFFEVHEHFDLRRPAAEQLDDGLRFRVPLRRRDRSRGIPDTLSFAWTATGLPILDGPSAVTGTVSVSLDRGRPAESADVVTEGSGLRSGLGAVAAGLLSYAVPAVLALLLLTLLQRRGEEGLADVRRGIGMLLTVCGIAGALALVALGGVVARAAGLELPWGFHLQDPRLVAALGVIVLLVALRLWLPRRTSDPTAGPPGSGLLLARGGLTVLLALVWMPPLLGEARRAGTLVALALFGLGLALPHVALWALPPRPAARRQAAMPGPRGRQALGFLAAATLVWLFYLLSQLIDTPRLAGVQLALLGVGLVAYFRSRPLLGGRSRAMLTLLLLAACALVVWVAGGPSA